MKLRHIERRRVDRRTTIKWLAATMVSTAAACQGERSRHGDEIPPPPNAANPALGTARAADVAGYGTDPDLLNPVVPWRRTMSDAQLRVSSALADLVLPADERSPAASELGVADFIDEWISAPYAVQQADRELVLPGLEWLERQSNERFGRGFADAAASEQSEIVDTIAWPDKASSDLVDKARFFDRFRYIAVGAFYTTDAGMADIGYTGNVAIAGSYPGPSPAALEHLAGVLEALGLEMPG